VGSSHFHSYMAIVQQSIAFRLASRYLISSSPLNPPCSFFSHYSSFFQANLACNNKRNTANCSHPPPQFMKNADLTLFLLTFTLTFTLFLLSLSPSPSLWLLFSNFSRLFAASLHIFANRSSQPWASLLHLSIKSFARLPELIITHCLLSTWRLQ
jgi:hypothetical protein